MMAWKNPAVIAYCAFLGTMHGVGWAVLLVGGAIIHKNFGGTGLVVTVLLSIFGLLASFLLAKVGVKGPAKPQPIDIGREHTSAEIFAYLLPLALTLLAGVAVVARMYQWI